jgi:hypothetical protein
MAKATNIAKAGILKKSSSKKDKKADSKESNIKIGTEIEWDMEDEKKKKDKGGKEQGKLF